MTPSFLPPEKGRSAEQGYHGRPGFQRPPEDEGKHLSVKARRWLMPGLVILFAAAAYLLSRALAG